MKKSRVRGPKEQAQDRARYQRLMADPALAERRRIRNTLNARLYRARRPQAYTQTRKKLAEQIKGDGVPRIYFIQAISGPIKIGHTKKRPDARLAELQIACFEELRLLGAIQGTRVEEQALHRRYKGALIRGEWFRPVPELTSFITTLLPEATFWSPMLKLDTQPPCQLD